MEKSSNSTGPLGLELIEAFEGCKLKAYQDTGGVWTIGIGTIRYPSGESVKQYDELKDRNQAVAYMMHELRGIELAVAELVNVPLDQHQFDAVVCFAYNCGTGALGNSTLLKKINSQATEKEIESQWMRWVYDNGKIIPGLVRRRKAEVYLYFTGKIKTEFQ